MAYLSLYRKYRPQTFDDILGQQHVSSTLANAINEDKVAHAFLFTGPRGTGKTSTARILAKALNCEQGPTPSPCGKCESCVAITHGSSLDVIELDAASHSGVDDTRDILQGVSLASAGGRKKVYVIDEVHMLTTPSFNALLKTLEEPPEHVVFILATTEAHKVLQTIRSRTQRFDFRPVPTEVIADHLAEIAKLEGIDVETPALEVVARHAEGGVRDALSTLDQLSSFGRKVTVEDVERLLGGRDDDVYEELFDAIAASDTGAIFWSVHSIVARGTDVRQVARGALAHARSLLLLKTAPDADHLLEASPSDRAALATQSERFTPSALLRIVDLLARSLTEMREAPNHRLLLEVALIRAAAPETDPGATGLLGRIERLERRAGIDAAAESGTQQGETPRQAAPPVAPAAGGPKGTPSKAPAPKTTAGSKKSPAPEVVAEEAPAADERAPATQGSSATVGYGAIKDSWSAAVREVDRTSKVVGALLKPSRPVRFEGDELIVEVQATFHAEKMAEERHRSLLAGAIHSVLGVSPQLSFVPVGSQEAPAEPQTAPAQDENTTDYESSTEAVAKDDPVELLKKGFGAEVVDDHKG